MIRQKGQLYWDDERVKLDDAMFKYMLSDDENTERYYNALSHFSSIRSEIEPSLLSHFQWIKMEYTVPYFMDLSFRFKNRVFGIIFSSIGKDGIVKDDSGWKDRADLCLEYDIIPVLLLFDDKNNVMNFTDDLFALISAERYREEGIIESVDPLKIGTDDFREMGDYEILNTAVMAIVENLHDKENIDEILYQTYPGVYPNIYWIDKNKALNWMIVETVKEKSARPEMPEKMIERIKLNSCIGHYALCEISYPFADSVYPRGQKFDLKFEITDL